MPWFWTLTAGRARRVHRGRPAGRLELTALEGRLAPASLAAVADFDGDGVPDLAVGRPGGQVTVRGGASGANLFDLRPFEAGFAGPVAVAAADFTGDGRAKLVAGDGFGGGPRVRVLDLAAGRTLSDYHAFEPEFRGGVSVAAADVTGDGRPDAVLASAAGQTLMVVPGTAAGFGARSLCRSASPPGGVALADVTGDGKLDAVLTDPAGQRLVTLPGSGDGTFGAPTIVPLTAAPGKVVALDVNADGKLDLAVTFPATDRVGFLYGRGAGRFTTAFRAAGPGVAGLAVYLDRNRNRADRRPRPPDDRSRARPTPAPWA